MNEVDNETYIGDGVYASFDGYQICLRTEREPGNWHEIYLDPQTYSALTVFRDQFYKVNK